MRHPCSRAEARSSMAASLEAEWRARPRRRGMTADRRRSAAVLPLAGRADEILMVPTLPHGSRGTAGCPKPTAKHHDDGCTLAKDGLRQRQRTKPIDEAADTLKPLPQQPWRHRPSHREARPPQGRSGLEGSGMAESPRRKTSRLCGDGLERLHRSGHSLRNNRKGAETAAGGARSRLKLNGRVTCQGRGWVMRHKPSCARHREVVSKSIGCLQLRAEFPKQAPGAMVSMGRFSVNPGAPDQPQHADDLTDGNANKWGGAWGGSM